MSIEYWLLYLGVIGIVTVPILILYAVLSIIARIFSNEKNEH